MDRAKTNPVTSADRIEALRLGIENALGLIEHVDAGAAVVELRSRLRNDDEVGLAPAGGAAPSGPWLVKRDRYFDPSDNFFVWHQSNHGWGGKPHAGPLSEEQANAVRDALNLVAARATPGEPT